MFYRQLFVLFLLAIALSVLFLFMDILITPLVSSSSSYKTNTMGATRGKGITNSSGAHPSYIIFME